jgi:hypothetical protein
MSGRTVRGSSRPSEKEHEQGKVMVGLSVSLDGFLADKK